MGQGHAVHEACLEHVLAAGKEGRLPNPSRCPTGGAASAAAPCAGTEGAAGGGEELRALPTSIPAAGMSPSAGTDTLAGCDTRPACRSGTTRAWSLPRAPGTALTFGSTAGAGGRGKPGHQGMSSGAQERSTEVLQPRGDGRGRVKEPHAHPRAGWCQPCRQPAGPGRFLCHKAQEQSQRAL